MSERAAEAIREAMNLYGRHAYSTRMDIGTAVAMFLDVASALEGKEPDEPGGEESTEDKPF